ncbi:MAG: hypothetical protein JXA66_00400 [Oligoflexia bacterium]|nr:hypothetical protein [Oligoflexia bacterium]
MKYIIAIMTFALMVYIYLNINENQKKQIVKERSETVKSLNSYEFNRSLHKVRAARARMKKPLKPYILEVKKSREQAETKPDDYEEQNTDMDIETIEENIENAEELKNDTVIPARPLRGINE